MTFPKHHHRVYVPIDALQQLWTADYSLNEIARLLGVGVNTVYRRAREYNLGPKPALPRRGHLNGRWVGGCEDYRGIAPEWEQAQRDTRHRDGHQCRRCGITATELGTAMPVHHIKPFNQFADPTDANQLSNLVSLCQSCHSKVEREPWELPAQPDPSLRGITSPDPGKEHIQPMIVNPEEVATRYYGGQPISQIVADLGCSLVTLYRALQRAGVRLNRKHEVDHQEVRRLLALGFNRKEVAQRLGINLATTYRSHPPATKLTDLPETRQRVIALHEQGIGTRSIAAQLGVGRSWVPRIIKAHKQLQMQYPTTPDRQRAA